VALSLLVLVLKKNIRLNNINGDARRNDK